MSGILLAAWIGIGLCCAVTAEEEKMTPPTVPNCGGPIPCELAGMRQAMNAMYPTLFAQHFAVGMGSCIDTKLQALDKKLEKILTETEESLNDAKTRLTETETRLVATERELEATKEKLNAAGSSFVRWGRTSCTNNSQLVYSGVAGGSWYDHSGAVANPLCLTMTPDTDNTPVPKEFALLYGGEYQEIINHHQNDVPCCVCRAAQSTTIMIPATQYCPSGWTPQYTGHLAAGSTINKAASQYVCLDRDPEDVPGGHANKNGYLFFYTVTRCGTLPCPPYTNDKVVLCVVCSK